MVIIEIQMTLKKLGYITIAKSIVTQFKSAKRYLN